VKYDKGNSELEVIKYHISHMRVPQHNPIFTISLISESLFVHWICFHKLYCIPNNFQWLGSVQSGYQLCLSRGVCAEPAASPNTISFT